MSHSHFPSIISCLDEQLANNMKKQLLLSQGKQTVEDILKTMQFRCRTTPHAGAPW
ncbi:unnamed protein product [Hymenolepis diminuta]|uniref:Uncharacterized protein n=1 Tax=Hymenolepis diminuta TaxID=6216 RepID=A0A564YUG0_HYMDI|nr:unnamed protein product [Hymenolepis diminuta]